MVFRGFYNGPLTKVHMYWTRKEGHLPVHEGGRSSADHRAGRVKLVFLRLLLLWQRPFLLSGKPGRTVLKSRDSEKNYSHSQIAGKYTLLIYDEICYY